MKENLKWMFRRIAQVLINHGVGCVENTDMGGLH